MPRNYDEVQWCCIRCGQLHAGAGEVCDDCDGKAPLMASEDGGKSWHRVVGTAAENVQAVQLVTVTHGLPEMSWNGVKAPPVALPKPDPTRWDDGAGDPVEDIKRAQKDVERMDGVERKHVVSRVQWDNLQRIAGDICSHAWHNCYPGARAARCPWCAEEEAPIDRTKKAQPDVGQVWCCTAQHDREHEIVDDDMIRGPAGYFKLKAYGYPAVWIGGEELTAGGWWLLREGPQTPQERFAHAIKLELADRPAGATELAWRRVVHGMVELAQSEGSKKYPNMARHAIRYVRRAFELAAGVADINENEDR